MTMLQRPALQDEEGASATVFVLSLTMLFAVALLALDGGSLFVSRRGQIADTDSAALAIAQHLADTPCDWDDPVTLQGIATDYAVTKNGSDRVGTPEVTPLAVDAAGCPTAATVVVSTERDVGLRWAALVPGVDTSATTGVTSGAVFGPLSGIDNLRPMGICIEDPHFVHERGPGSPWPAYDASDLIDVEADYRNDWPEMFIATNPKMKEDFVLHPLVNKDLALYPVTSRVHRMTFFEPEAADWCGGGPNGHFGWLDFDGEGAKDDVEDDCSGIPGSQELSCDVANGFQGRIKLAPPNCAPTTDTTLCGVKPGETQGAKKGLEEIVCPSAGAAPDDCTKLFIVVYSRPSPPPSDGDFVLEDVIPIILRDFNTDNNPKNPNTNYIDIEFVDGAFAVGDVDPTLDSISGLEGAVLCRANTFDNCPTVAASP